MSASDTEYSRKAAKTALTYLLISLFCALVGAVYECFSHGVYSYFMLYAFVFPLAGGALPYLLLSLYPREPYPASVERNLHHSGIAAFTVGSVICGILEIYGTTNRLTRIYWYAGIVFTGAGVLLYLLRLWTHGHEA